MKKGRETSSKLMPILVAAIVCLCTVVGFGAKEYLMGGLKQAPVSYAPGTSGVLYRVLEIEPGWDYMYDEADKKNAIATALGTTADKISFKYVSTPEFNGMNEDLVASYDIIVFGLNTGTMNKKDGKTIYNDRSLDGYIYLAYGDLVKYDNRMAGMSVYDYVCIDEYVNGTKGIPVNYEPNGSGNGTIYLDENSNAQTTNWKGQWTLYNMNHVQVWTPAMREYFDGQYYVLKDINSMSWTNAEAYYNDKTGNARFSGNDITKKKVEELLDFVSTKRPVVLADGLYTCVNDNTASANSNKNVYPTSNMYDFLEAINGNEKVNKLSEINVGNKLKNAVRKNNLEITAHTMKYQDSSNSWVSAPNITYDGNGLINDNCIINNVEKFRYTVDFKAEIGKNYYVKVIVDKDTDGRFDSVATIDDFNEVYYATIVEANAELMQAELDINLAENYNGMFGWQILVEELDASKNPVDRVSVEGHTVVKGQTKYIKVLQLTPGTSTNLNVGDTSTTGFGGEMSKASTKIGYTISVTTMTVGAFEEWFKSNPYDGYKGENDYLNKYGYNMLIMGFLDSYNKEDISNDFGALNCVEDFISNGNSVLFSHDTMHFPVSGNMGISAREEDAGGYYSSHSWWCNGWNHYGCTWVNTKELQLYFQSGWNERAGTIMALGMRDMFGMDRYDITSTSSYTDPLALDAANVPKDINGNYITETQGFTNMFLLWLNTHRNYVTDSRPTEIHTLVYNKNITEYDSQYDQILTNRVEEINQGQITMYPYKVTSDGFLNVNTTHAQYYQLDLEDDDLVVWYTLAKNTSGNRGDMYNDSRRDAANNYYIYSKGNVTYTGAGHSTIGDTNGTAAGGMEEVRLFVNTVIRTAAAGNFIPQVKCVNGFTTRNANTYVVNPKPFDTEYLIQFEAFDEDLATKEVIKDSYPEAEWNEHIGRFASGMLYWVDEGGNTRPLKKYNRTNPSNYLLNGETTSFTIYNPLENGKTMEQINADMYLKNMYDCYMLYQTKGTVELRVDATDYYGETGTSTIHVTKQELFDLD